MKAIVMFLTLGAALAGVVWAYKQWETNQDDNENELGV